MKEIVKLIEIAFVLFKLSTMARRTQPVVSCLLRNLDCEHLKIVIINMLLLKVNLFLIMF